MLVLPVTLQQLPLFVGAWSIIKIGAPRWRVILGAAGLVVHDYHDDQLSASRCGLAVRSHISSALAASSGDRLPADLQSGTSLT